MTCSTRQADHDLLARLRRELAANAAPTPPSPGGEPSAAVLVLLDPSSPGIPVLFLQRSNHVRHHRNQIGLPGGRAETHDQNAPETALREAHEELGVPPDAVEVIGTLTPVLTAVSNHWLVPVVAVQVRQFDVVPDDFEVAEWFRLPLVGLLKARHEVRAVEGRPDPTGVHFYTMGERVVWGVTGGIIHELLSLLGRTD